MKTIATSRDHRTAAINRTIDALRIMRDMPVASVSANDALNGEHYNLAIQCNDDQARAAFIVADCFRGLAGGLSFIPDFDAPATGEHVKHDLGEAFLDVVDDAGFRPDPSAILDRIVDGPSLVAAE